MRHFFKHKKGSFSTILAISIPVFFLAAFEVIDFMRFYYERQQIEQSLDIATIAAASALITTQDYDKATLSAERFFLANYKNINGVNVILNEKENHVTLEVDEDNNIFDAYVVTDRHSIINKNTTAAKRLNQHNARQAALTPTGNDLYEFAFVIDTTASMNNNTHNEFFASSFQNSRMYAVRQAINGILNQMNNQSNYWVSVVPFTNMVRLAEHDDNNRQVKFGNLFYTSPDSNWGGCTMARDGSYDISLDLPDYGIGQSSFFAMHPGRGTEYDVRWHQVYNNIAACTLEEIVLPPEYEDVCHGYLVNRTSGEGPSSVECVGTEVRTMVRDTLSYQQYVCPDGTDNNWIPSAHFVVNGADAQRNVCNGDTSVEQLKAIKQLGNDLVAAQDYMDSLEPVSHYLDAHEDFDHWGSTQMHRGVLWGAKVLNDSWKANVWNVNNNPLDPIDNDPQYENTSKVMVLFTDGENTTYGMPFVEIGEPDILSGEYILHTGGTFNPKTHYRQNVYRNQLLRAYQDTDSILSENSDHYHHEFLAHYPGSMTIPLPDITYFGAYKYGLEKHIADQKTLEACQLAKDSGVAIFVVSLQSANSAANNLLQQCATDPEYFFSVETEAEIADKLRFIKSTAESGKVRFVSLKERAAQNE